MILSARYDRKKLALLLLGSAIFTAVSYGLALTSDPFVYGVAQVAFLGFLFLTILNAMRMFDDREILRIDETGVFDRRIVDRTVPWRLIEDVKEVRIVGLRFFAVVSNEPLTDFISSRPKRFTSWLNEKLGFYRMGVNTNGLSINHAQLNEAFAAYAPRSPDETDASPE